MAITGKDGQDSTEVFSGDTRIWGVISDIYIVKEMNIRTVGDKIMRFTPDGIPVTDKAPAPIPFTPPESDTAGERDISRLSRTALNLDKMYVTQTYWEPKNPRAFSRADEYHANTGKPDDTGLNPANIAAIGKATDIFRISIAKNISEIAVTEGSEGGTLPSDALSEEWDKRSSYNDYLGSYPGRPDLIFGRFEIRCTAHFYLNDHKTAPLAFTLTEWPRDENPLDKSGKIPPEFPFGVSREIFVDQQKVEQHTLYTLEASPGDPGGPIVSTAHPGLAGQILTGALALDKANHAFGILVSLPRHSNCNLTNTTLATATGDRDGTYPVTIDDRVTIFSKTTCPHPEAVATKCETTKETSFISCLEIGSQKYNERWITVVDRINSLIHELDRVYCIIKSLSIKADINLDTSYLLWGMQKLLVDHLIASSVPTSGDAGMMAIKDYLKPETTPAFKFEAPVVCTGL